MTASVQRAGNGLAVSGNMTIETAKSLLQAGTEAIREGSADFDLKAVAEVDSSGLAVLFGWQRAAGQMGKPFRISNPPHNLSSLASVYGVSGLLPLV